MKRFQLSRRALLRGAGGAALALPFLEIMRRSNASAGPASAAPKRLIVWSMPNGSVADQWRTPPGPSETEFTLSPTLAPLASVQQHMVIVQQLQCRDSYGHHVITSMTGHAAQDDGYPNLRAKGPSFDQYIAQHIGDATPIPSLQLGVQVTQNRETVACASWAGADAPRPSENDPYRVYAELFGEAATAGDDSARRRLLQRRSVLDSVLEQTSTLSRRLGRRDRDVVNNYYDSVRDLEVRLSRLDAASCGVEVPPDPTVAGETPTWLRTEQVPEVIDVMHRLSVHALACDRTRVITLSLANDGGAYRFHPWLGLADSDWHGHSHAVETGVADGLAAIERWHYARLAELIQSLDATADVDGTSLLENTLVFVSNEYGPNGAVEFLPPNDDGSRPNLTHRTVLMPYLLFGQAGGALRTGRNLVYDFRGEPGSSDYQHHARNGEGRHHTQLLVSILQLMGLPDETFGDPTSDQGPLPGLV